jgi:polysaccharide pyruvyl transferase WcaK-like protein
LSVKKLAKDFNKKVIVVGQNFEWADENVPADPFEFLGLIENADFIVTDTFHGTVLSIALNKQFAVAAYKEKVFRIIEQFELLDRNVDRRTDITDVFNKIINYDAINYKISELRRQSLDYISSCFNL